MLKASLTLVWLVILAAGMRVVTAKTKYYGDRDYQLLSPPPLSEIDPRLVDVATLGHRGLYDDFISIWLMQAFVDERLKEHSAEEVSAAINVVTRLNPRIESLYMLSCFVMAQDYDRPDLCERISLDGLKALPDSWRIPLTQGFMEAYKLHQPKNAALYYGLAASRPDAPEFLKSLAAKLVANSQLSLSDLQESIDKVFENGASPKLGEFLKSHGKRPEGQP